MDLAKVFYLNMESDYAFPQETGIGVVSAPSLKTQDDNYYILSLRPHNFDSFINKIRPVVNFAAVICLELDYKQIMTLFQLPDLIVYIGMPTKELLLATLSDESKAKQYMENERRAINTVRTFEEMLLGGTK